PYRRPDHSELHTELSGPKGCDEIAGPDGPPRPHCARFGTAGPGRLGGSSRRSPDRGAVRTRRLPSWHSAGALERTQDLAGTTLLVLHVAYAFVPLGLATASLAALGIG